MKAQILSVAMNGDLVGKLTKNTDGGMLFQRLCQQYESHFISGFVFNW